jgi:hypothetical protein
MREWEESRKKEALKENKSSEKWQKNWGIR